MAIAVGVPAGEPAAATASPAPAASARPGYSAHGLVITASNAAATWMPMTARPAFTGSAMWFLGNPTSAGMHAGTLTFAASAPGTYRYLCPVPGHARDGMTGSFIVR